MLTALRFSDPPPSERGAFPFTIPALKGLGTLPLSGPVTFFAGENGSGKSTLLEALAIVARLPTVGGEEAARDDSLASQRALARTLTAVWKRRSHRGFFLRAEDFFGFIRRLALMRAEMKARLEEVERDYRGRSALARQLARGPAMGSLAAMRERYGDDLDANSHGESFLRLFRSRFVPGGLYLLDEPESALSPQSQLGLIAMMREMVDEGGQFVIATHSPLLLAVPGATIYSFDRAPLGRVAWSELESVALWRDFVAAPERYLRRLWPTR